MSRQQVEMYRNNEEAQEGESDTADEPDDEARDNVESESDDSDYN